MKFNEINETGQASSRKDAILALLPKFQSVHFEYDSYNGIHDSPETVIKEVENALKKLSINVFFTKTPSTKGSDSVGFIITTEKINKSQIKEIDNELSGISDED
jgi:hypothetical protein